MLHPTKIVDTNCRDTVPYVVGPIGSPARNQKLPAELNPSSSLLTNWFAQKRSSAEALKPSKRTWQQQKLGIAIAVPACLNNEIPLGRRALQRRCCMQLLVVNISSIVP